MAVQTDSILIKATLTSHVPERVSYVRDWLGAIPALAHAHLRPVWSEALHQLVLYIDLPETRALDDSDLTLVEHVVRLSFPDAETVSASRLLRVFDVPGASSGEPPAFHYIVETDAAAGWMDEIGRWYDTEHMPGLAAVPGCVRASRFLNQDHSPLSVACYDLVGEDTLGSAPWLAVRGSDWSSRVRPHFTNTLRTMFTVGARAAAESL